MAVDCLRRLDRWTQAEGGGDNDGLNWRDHLSLCVCGREKKENMIPLETEMRE